MSKPRVLTGILSTVFCLTLVASVRADMAHVEMSLEKEIYAQRHNLTSFDTEFAKTGYLYAEHFENNNGKHLGFSVSTLRRGLKDGAGRETSPSVTENPEPTAMVLLGSGLTAIAALARRKNRKRAIR